MKYPPPCCLLVESMIDRLEVNADEPNLIFVHVHPAVSFVLDGDIIEVWPNRENPVRWIVRVLGVAEDPHPIIHGFIIDHKRMRRMRLT